MQSFREIIAALGGPTQFANKMGIKVRTALSMHNRDNITIKHWPKLIQVAKAEKVNGIHQKRLTELSIAKTLGTPPAPETDSGED